MKVPHCEGTLSLSFPPSSLPGCRLARALYCCKSALLPLYYSTCVAALWQRRRGGSKGEEGGKEREEKNGGVV